MKSAYIYNKRVFAVDDKNIFLEEVIKQKNILIAMNSKKIVFDEKNYSEIINNNISYPDGSPVAMILKKKGLKSVKYAGHKLWLDIINKTYKNKNFYIIGATSEVVKEVVEKLKKDYSGINIVNYRNGYLCQNEVKLLKKDLKTKKPDIVFVAMGFPKQDYFMQELFNEYQALYMGVGGSFNVYIGKASLVPDWWMKIIKSEGLYRILQNPKKIPKLIYHFKFWLYYIINKL